MAEAVSFWLDNKMSSGIKVAEAGGQIMVSYREKFYVVEKGAALMKGSKPLHYSKSSIPTVWRKVMAGKMPLDSDFYPQEEENLPMATSTKKERIKVNKDKMEVSKTVESAESPVKASQQEFKKTADVKSPSEPRPARNIKKTEVKPAAATVVVTTCPYCMHKHDVPLDKGKNGKAFLLTCIRCSNEFAVRFVPVTVYQAQVAAFK